MQRKVVKSKKTKKLALQPNFIMTKKPLKVILNKFHSHIKNSDDYVKAIEQSKSRCTADGFKEVLKEFMTFACCQKNTEYLELFVSHQYLQAFHDAKLSIDCLQFAIGTISLLAAMIEEQYLNTLNYVLCNQALFKFNLNALHRGRTAIASAIIANNIEIFDYLLAQNVDLNAGEKRIILVDNIAEVESAPPIFYAVLLGNLYMLDKLLAANANAQDTFPYMDKTYDLLGFALRAKQLKAYSFLLARGVQRIPGTFCPLSTAINRTDHIFMEVLASYPDHEINQLRVFEDNKWSLLSYASLLGSLEMMQALVKRGAHIHGHPDEDHKPIENAVTSGDIAKIEWLIAAGANQSEMQLNLLNKAFFVDEAVLKYIFKLYENNPHALFQSDYRGIRPVRLIAEHQFFEKLYRLLGENKQSKIKPFAMQTLQQQLFSHLIALELPPPYILSQIELLTRPIMEMDVDNFLNNFRKVMVKQFTAGQSMRLFNLTMQCIDSLFHQLSAVMRGGLQSMDKLASLQQQFINEQSLSLQAAIEKGVHQGSDTPVRQEIAKLCKTLMQIFYPSIMSKLTAFLDTLDKPNEIENIFNNIDRYLQLQDKLSLALAKLLQLIKGEVSSNDFSCFATLSNSYFIRVRTSKNLLQEKRLAFNRRQVEAEKMAAAEALRKGRLAEAAAVNSQAQVIITPQVVVKISRFVPRLKDLAQAVIVANEKRKKELARMAKQAIKKEKNKQRKVVNEARSLYLYERLQTLIKYAIKLNIQSLPGELYLIGGAIISLLLNKYINDLDFIYVCAEKKKLETKRLFEMKFWQSPYFESLFTLRRNGVAVDLTRVNAANHKWMKDDYIKRDFTICALYIHLDKNAQQYKIIDPSGLGLADVHDRRLRMLGEPMQRFSSNPVQVLRAIKYMLSGFQPDAKLVHALQHWHHVYAIEKHATHFAAVMKRYLDYPDLYSDHALSYAERFVSKMLEYNLVERLFGFRPAATLQATIQLIRQKVENILAQAREGSNQPAQLQRIGSLFAHASRAAISAEKRASIQYKAASHSTVTYSIP